MPEYNPEKQVRVSVRVNTMCVCGVHWFNVSTNTV